MTQNVNEGGRQNHMEVTGSSRTYLLEAESVLGEVVMAFTPEAK